MTKTVADHARHAEARLLESDLHFAHGCDNPRDEAIWATMHVAGLMHHEFEEICDQRLSANQSDDLHKLIEARIESRKPLAYLIREAWFAGRPFYVDERAIVPRSHFGDLVQDGFGPCIDPRSVKRILDLCTGSGCIAVAMALEFPHATVDAADIDAEALQVAQINIERFKCSGRVRAIESSLFDRLEGECYDLIVSNPPYIDALTVDSLPTEYLHEPRRAFAAHERGIGFARQILSQASGYLSDHGFLLMELGDSAKTLESAFPDIPFMWLTTRSGESVVLMISAQELKIYRNRFKSA